MSRPWESKTSISLKNVPSPLLPMDFLYIHFFGGKTHPQQSRMIAAQNSRQPPNSAIGKIGSRL
jgi:hypothetical protein